jgi:hypothetical protein
MPEMLLKVYDSRFDASWSAIPDHILEALAPSGTAYLTTKQRAALNRLAAGRWFLVKNVLREPCNPGPPFYGCGGIHPYMTIRCTESPLNGLRQVYAWIDSLQDKERFVAGMREFFAINPDFDMIQAISPSDAAIYNQRIRDRHGVPVIDQQPLRREELDAEVMNRRMIERARTAERKLAALGI